MKPFEPFDAAALAIFCIVLGFIMGTGRKFLDH